VNAEQWFWMLMVIANALSMGIRIALMQRDGIHWSDWMFISGGLIIMGYAAYVVGSS